MGSNHPGPCENATFGADFGEPGRTYEVCANPAEYAYALSGVPRYEMCHIHTARALREYAALMADGVDAADVAVTAI